MSTSLPHFSQTHTTTPTTDAGALSGAPAVEQDTDHAQAANRLSGGKEGCRPRPRRNYVGHRETSDLTGAVVRMLRSLSKRFADGEEDPGALECVKAIGAEFDALLDVAVPTLRRIGYSDRQIAEGLGVTRQAVSQRWKREAS